MTRNVFWGVKPLSLIWARVEIAITWGTFVLFEQFTLSTGATCQMCVCIVAKDNNKIFKPFAIGLDFGCSNKLKCSQMQMSILMKAGVLLRNIPGILQPLSLPPKAPPPRTLHNSVIKHTWHLTLDLCHGEVKRVLKITQQRIKFDNRSKHL